MAKIVFGVLVLAGAVCLITAIVFFIINIRNRRKYGRIASSVLFGNKADKINKKLLQNKYYSRLNSEISYKISVFNSVSYERNRQISVFVIFGFAIFILVLSIVLICVFWPYWYIAFMYIAFAITAILFLVQFVSEFIMSRYLKKLPEAIKILQSRFMSKGSIAKAIQVSIPDLPSGIKSEMIRLYDAMKQNETEKTKEVFGEIDRKYANEHMSVLLDIIRIAHYNGGTDEIKAQFEAMIRDVIEDLENQQDLRGAAISYIVMSVLFMFVLPLVKMYNGSILSASEMAYYDTRSGMLFAAAYVGFLFLLIAFLFYLKKKG